MSSIVKILGERWYFMNTNRVFNNIKDCFQNDIVYGEGEILLINGDSLKQLKKIPDNSIALILTDPPYHSTKKKNIVGDTSFNSNNEYIEWMERYSIEWKRILKHNGSVFCFCSSEMASHLEVMFSKEFNILSQIVWTKPNEPGYDGWKKKMKKEALRQWYPHSERIIFMEPAYEGNLFRTYFGNMLKQWRREAKISAQYLAEVTQSYGKINHGGAVSNWEAGRNMPSKEQYKKIIEALVKTGKLENLPIYEDMIRPFNVDSNVEFTDVWSFQNVRQYKGKHPAEKPLDLLKHAILSTTYEGDIVLDCFGGSGSTALAARETGRKCISIELEEKWSIYAKERLNDNINV